MHVEKDLAVIRSQMVSGIGLTVASTEVSDDPDVINYNRVWIRDNVYVALAFVQAGQLHEAADMYGQLCKMINNFEPLLDQTEYPTQDDQLLPARFSIDGQRINEKWSNRQYDAIGLLLFGLGQLNYLDPTLVNKEQRRIAQKLINYLQTCRYWQDPDNGMWENEEEELHSSSLAACICGIQMVSDFCNFDKAALEKAKANLEAQLPAESATRPVDMSELSLIWPYGYKRQDIVDHVESQLLKQYGVIRYEGDVYESDGGVEPQWVMGIPWLGVANFMLGNRSKAEQYLSDAEQLYTRDGNLPEAYLAQNKDFHTPLAWSHAMMIVLRTKLGK